MDVAQLVAVCVLDLGSANLLQRPDVLQPKAVRRVAEQLHGRSAVDLPDRHSPPEVAHRGKHVALDVLPSSAEDHVKALQAPPLHDVVRDEQLHGKVRLARAHGPARDVPTAVGLADVLGLFRRQADFHGRPLP